MPLHAISFKDSENEFRVFDLPAPKELALKDQDYRGTTFIAAKGDIKFVNCLFDKLYQQDGSLSLVSCQAKKVEANRHVLLKNCSNIGLVKAGEKVAALGCTDIKKFDAKDIYMDTAAVKTEITGTFHRLIRSSIEGFIDLVIPHCRVTGSVNASKNTKSIILDGTCVEKNVNFPEDSLVPANEREVLLQNGGQVMGSVRNARLIIDLTCD